MAELAKVYVWKDPEEDKPWTIGTYVGGMIAVTKHFDSYAEAWEWLYENYVREVS